MTKIRVPHAAASYQGAVEADTVRKLPKALHTFADGTVTETWSPATHDSGVNSWNRSTEDSIAHPAGKPHPTAVPDHVPVANQTRVLNRKRVVGDRASLYQEPVGNRNPVAPLKYGAFTQEEND